RCLCVSLLGRSHNGIAPGGMDWRRGGDSNPRQGKTVGQKSRKNGLFSPPSSPWYVSNSLRLSPWGRILFRSQSSRPANLKTTSPLNRCHLTSGSSDRKLCRLGSANQLLQEDSQQQPSRYISSK